ITMRVFGERDSFSEITVVLGGTVHGLMGTDTIGRDLAVGLLLGFPTSLFVGVVTSIFVTAVGAVLGTIGGYLGGGIDEIIQRSAGLQVRESQFVEAARVLGSSTYRIVFLHVFPQVAPFIVAQMIFFVPNFILLEAALSFLGLGDPSLPTWGQLLELGFRNNAVYLGYWWWILPPGISIVAVAVVFVLIALGMEPVVNPRLRKR
ncbi:MAG: ABC transporter permease, partial [Candidatus Caldarchaeum sp.]|nr:ABC transporter permease [Candidatus Caldarchaeum sp.]